MSDGDDDGLARLADLLARDRMSALIDGWARDGLVSHKVGRKLAATLPPDPTAEAPATPEPATPAPAALPPPEPDAHPHVHVHDDARHAGDAAAAMFSAPHTTHGAVDALAALDHPGAFADAPPAPDAPSRWEAEVRPLLYENVGWFIGTLFVLAGSVYGVREAWRSLGGVPRHLLVASALFAYHAGFAGLARLLASRSASTGRVLGAISLGLLPVVFVALSSLTALAAPIGIAASLVCVAVATLTLRSVSARFDGAPRFSHALLPLLAAEVPLARLAGDSPFRVALCFVGAAVTAWVAHRTFPREEPASDAPDAPPHALVAALYGSLALTLFAVTGSSDGGSDLRTLAPGYALWTAVFAGVLSATCAGVGAARRFPRATPSVEVVSLAVGALATLWEAKRALSTFPSDTAGSAMAALTAAVSALAFAYSSRRHHGALHFVPLAAALSTAMVARAIAPLDPAWWVFGAMVAPCACIASTMWLAGGAHLRDRRALVGWGVALSIPLGLTALVVGALVYDVPGRWPATVATLALLALTAHATASRGSRGLHALGAFAALTAAFTAALPAFTGLSLLADAITVGAQTTLACAALASLSGALTRDDAPDARQPLRAARDALSTTAMAGFGVGALLLMAWISSWDEVTRARAIEGAVILALSSLVAFAGRGFAIGDLRASPVALWACGASIALAAVSNRIGRPLPPHVVGWKLSLIAVAVWLLARGLVAAGPKLAARLGRPERGGSYHLVAHAGVFALGAVLVIDAAIVGAPSLDRALLVTPPTMLLGGALAMALLGRSAGHAGWTTVAYALGVAGAALVGAQRSLLGVTSVQTSVYGALRWVPAGTLAALDPTQWRAPGSLLQPGQTLLDARYGALLAAALAAALYAFQSALMARVPRARAAVAWGLLGRGGDDLRAAALSEVSSLWSALAAAAVTLSMAWRPDARMGALVTLTGALLLAGRARRSGALVAAAGAVSLVHALAAESPSVPWYTGAATMLLAVMVTHAGPWIARRYEADPARVYGRTQALALAVALVALVDALAAGQPFTSAWLAGDLTWGALLGLAGRWMRSPALPVTLALGAWVSGVAARQWGSARDGEHGDTAATTAAWAVLLAGFAVCAGLTVGYVAAYAVPSPSGLTLPFARGVVALRVLGAPLAFASSLVALGAHAAGRLSPPGRSRSAGDGARFGRDAWLAGSIVFLAVYSGLARASGEPRPAVAAPAGVLAMAVGVAVAGHAAWREATARHVYFVQTAIVAVYGLARAGFARELPPEVDALFALVMGFLLVGVTVQARRAGVPPVAEATRRFAALMPIAIALVMPQQATGSAALAAAGSALLYATLGWVERSRLFGSLGAAAGNLALFVFAMSEGWSGPEVGAVPLGLFVLALGQIFGATLSHGSRVTLRVIGALLLYLPAASQVVLQVGNARDGMYPVLFGLACLAGVAAGMLLQIRAYLALGLGFLVLDVAASLVQAGLRDHRVGFLLLSTSGLAILGVMVLTTLRRDAFRAWTAHAKARLRSWD